MEKIKLQVRWKMGRANFVEQAHCQLAIFALCRPKSITLQFMVISELLTFNYSCMSNNFLSFVEGNESESSVCLSDVICPLMESKCQISSEMFFVASDKFKCFSMEMDSITMHPPDDKSEFSECETPLFEDMMSWSWKMWSWMMFYKGSNTINS